MTQIARRLDAAHQVWINAWEERLRSQIHDVIRISVESRELKKKRDALLATNRSLGCILKKLSSQMKMSDRDYWTRKLRRSRTNNRMKAVQLKRSASKMLEKLESKQDTIRRMQKNFKDNLIETDSKHPLMERAGLLLEEVLATWNEINTLYQVCNILLEIFDCNDN